MNTELDKLYQPSIADLELNEHQGKNRPVVYLDDVQAALLAIIAEERLDELEEATAYMPAATRSRHYIEERREELQTATGGKHE